MQRDQQGGPDRAHDEEVQDVERERDPAEEAHRTGLEHRLERRDRHHDDDHEDRADDVRADLLAHLGAPEDMRQQMVVERRHRRAGIRERAEHESVDACGDDPPQVAAPEREPPVASGERRLAERHAGDERDQVAVVRQHREPGVRHQPHPATRCEDEHREDDERADQLVVHRPQRGVVRDAARAERR